MMKMSDYLAQELKETGVSEAEFQELIIRLLNYSVIVRDESQTEERFYDRLLRCQQLVEEYLAVMGIQLYLDNRFDYARVYPPASEIPGIKEAEENAFSGSLRQRLSQYEVALVLIVRAQYEKALKEGKIDENGYALDSIESITIAVKNLLGRSLPEKLTERKKLFLKLRQLRLIEYRADEAFESGEGWLKIHPMIISFVSHQAIDAMSEFSKSHLVADETKDSLEKLGNTVKSARMDYQQDEASTVEGDASVS